MPSNRNWWWAAVTSLSLAALAWLLPDVEPVPTPILAPSQAVAPSVDAPAATRLGPWGSAASPRATVPVPSVASVPSAPVSVDRESLGYVGTVLTETNEKRFFFKVRPTGQMLTLVEGVPTGSWTLLSVQDKRYQIRGPEGLYEVVP